MRARHQRVDRSSACRSAPGIRLDSAVERYVGSGKSARNGRRCVSAGCAWQANRPAQASGPIDMRFLYDCLVPAGPGNSHRPRLEVLANSASPSWWARSQRTAPSSNWADGAGLHPERVRAAEQRDRAVPSPCAGGRGRPRLQDAAAPGLAAVAGAAVHQYTPLRSRRARPASRSITGGQAVGRGRARPPGQRVGAESGQPVGAGRKARSPGSRRSVAARSSSIAALSIAAFGSVRRGTPSTARQASRAVAWSHLAAARFDQASPAARSSPSVLAVTAWYTASPAAPDASEAAAS